ncbi:hypothetical protein [uncultured Selenomonas sp.]|uniref:hypothetical protein n=1 Tax=uncultured Selenomonas sp. TaxID=159275 RepID=UPI0028E20C6E|nr:hypothetical protein [uncultured Selenomonas sp.]
MFNGLKARRQLAVYVALGLSTGGGLLFSVPSAYAADTHDYTETAASINGLEGTDKTNSMSDNRITLGTEGGATDKPFSTWGTISGGGKKNATADVSNNTLTIHGLKVSNGGGQSMIYGGVSGTGAVTGNKVFFNNGLSKDPIYGGFNGASATKAVTGNSVTVADGTVEGDVQGGGTEGTGAVTGNTVTLKGGTFGDEAMGGIIRNASSSADVTGNTVTISGGKFTRTNTYVHGGYTQGTGKTINNTVNLGDGENPMATGFDLTGVKIYGGNKTNNVTGNTLNVNASGIVVRTAQNFEKYNFNLTKGVAAGSTMLKMTDSGGFGSTPDVQWGKITMNAEGWNADTTKYGRLGTMELLRAGGGADLKIFNTAALDRKATSGDFEYHMYTDVTTPPMSYFGYNMVNYVRADIDRFKNADATADNVTGTAVYGGYSSLGNTTTNNKIKITNTNNTNLNVYGGYTAGAGDSTKNTVTIAGASKVKNVYGGYVTAANAKADGNTVNIESGSTVSGHIYGGYATAASGTTKNNTVNLGDADHTDFAGTTLTNSEIHGGNKSNVTGNTLNVNAKNIAAKSVNNFENYKFKLNSATAFDDTMLTVTNAGDFAGTGVDMNKITVDRTGLTTDYLATQHGIKRMTLMKRSNTADTLKFRNYAAKKAADATETHEFRFVTNSGTGTANALMLEASRFKGSRVTYDGSTASYNGEIYGGISREGHTTTDNQLTVTAIHGTDDPKYAFGGKNEGTTGDVTNSHATINLQNAADEIAEVYGGILSNEDNAGEVSGNSVTMQKGTVQKVFGGYTVGTGTVKNNAVNFSGSESVDHIAGAYVENVANASEVTGNKVVFTGGTADNINGAVSEGTGALKTNTIAFSGTGSMANALRGAFSKTQGLVEANGVTISGGMVDSAFGAVTDGTGIATKNYVTVSGGTVNTEIAGGVGYNVTANTVTISGGTVSGDVYGGKSSGPSSSTSGNIVNLGAEDGTYTANLTNAALHGDNNSGTGATLNVRAKNITAKSADKFENYTFHLNDDIARNGGSMLTLTENNGFNDGNLFDWTKLDVDTSRLSGNTVIGNATLLTGTTNRLKFSNYAGKDRTHGVVNGDYETALRTDTNTGTASKVILDYNRFQNNTNATYDGSVAPTQLTDGTTEIYGGISYAGNTTKNNHLTVTGVQGNLTSAYGGKTAGAKGDAVKNSVTVEQTNRGGNAGAISNVFGGYTSSTEATAKAEDNTVTIKDGTVGAVYGGYAENAASAAGNHVFIQGGTVQNAVVGGGGKNTATGNMSGNDITITGGTVSGMIIGGDSRVLTSTSNKNIINLGDDTGAYAAHLSSAQIWGTSYGGNVLANDNAKIAGNTLNVKAKNGAEVAKVRNVQKFSFQLHDDTTKTAPLLKMADADGFGANAAVKWENVTVDLSKVTTATDAAKIQGKNTYTLMRGANNKLKFSDYAARYGTYAGVYETGLRTDATANSGTVTATNVLYDINRFKDGRVTYTSASTGEALGGYSAFGNTTTGNQLTVSGVTGTLAAAYGAQTAGPAGGSVNNKVTVAGTGTGSVTNVYGGAITNAANGGNVTGNTVTLTGGTVTGKIYGGYTAGNGKTTVNTVNLGADPTTLRQGDASTLATGTNFTAAELYGGNKSDVVTGNTLNVTVKDAAAKKAQNFDKYTFYLTNSVAADKPSSGTIDDTYTTSRGTMLTLTNGFDGQTADWDKVTVDTSKLSADKTLGAITLMKSTAANKLKFSNYAAKNHAVSGDYEVVQRTDTNTGDANAVLIDVNRFKNGDVIYDGVNPNAKTYAGVSYGGNTAEKNIMTLTGIASGNTVDYLSGGRSEGTAGGAVNNTVNLLGTGAGTLKSVYGGYIGKATNAADATGNTVNIAGGTAQNVYGGYTNGTGKTTGNIVNIGYTDKNGAFHAVADGTKVTGTIYGGSQSDDVTGNTLNVRGAITAGQIANFEKLNFAVNKDTAGKTLLSINGTAATTGLDWKKLTADIATADLPTKSYSATRVTLMANDKGIGFTNYDRAKELVADDVYEFSVDRASDGKSVYADGYRFKDNKLATFAETDGTHAEAWGGKSVLGKTVEGNVLTITGGTITDTAYGGTSSKGKAQNNKLVMHGGDVQTLKGGFGKTATDNTVDIFGGTVRGDVYGGHATNGAASNNTVNLYHGVTIGGVIHGGAGNTDSTNNTLAVRSFGTTAKDFDGVQNLHFYLPAGTTSSETRTMLTLTNAPAVKDISTLNLGVAAVAADARAFRRGDAVSLLKTNGTLTTAAQLRNTGDAQTMKATQSGILDYTMRLEKRGENELIATVDRVDVNDRSKSPVETRVAASALLNAGADLLSNVGYTAAAEAAAVISAGTAPASSSAEGTRNTDAGLVAAGTAASAGANATAAVSGAFQPWAAQGGSSVRLNSGSYVDAKGWNLNVGFARTNEMKDAKLTYGPFVEYGRGTYDSYLDDGTHGSGAMHYVGGGVMAKMSQNSGLYVEGSLRAGRVSSDYTGSDDAAELSYDNASTYFAGHVGVGQEWKLAGGDKIEGYAKYFYSHQAGNTTKLRSGGTLEFGDVDSHRLRVGARYTHAVGGGSELYAGLAYEHEFGGDATATYQGYSTPSPSLGGGTGILELGYRFAPKDGRVSYGVNLMGMTGQREGIAGGAQVTWAF